VRRWAASRYESRNKSNKEIWEAELMHDYRRVAQARERASELAMYFSPSRRSSAREASVNSDLYFSRVLI
jgi:hypothetical protein